jgi:hypothetical protein
MARNLFSLFSIGTTSKRVALNLPTQIGPMGAELDRRSDGAMKMLGFRQNDSVLSKSSTARGDPQIVFSPWKMSFMPFRILAESRQGTLVSHPCGSSLCSDYISAVPVLGGTGAVDHHSFFFFFFSSSFLFSQYRDGDIITAPGIGGILTWD